MFLNTPMTASAVNFHGPARLGNHCACPVSSNLGALTVDQRYGSGPAVFYADSVADLTPQLVSIFQNVQGYCVLADNAIPNNSLTIRLGVSPDPVRTGADIVRATNGANGFFCFPAFARSDYLRGGGPTTVYAVPVSSVPVAANTVKTTVIAPTVTTATPATVATSANTAPASPVVTAATNTQTEYLTTDPISTGVTYFEHPAAVADKAAPAEKPVPWGLLLSLGLALYGGF